MKLSETIATLPPLPLPKPTGFAELAAPEMLHLAQSQASPGFSIIGLLIVLLLLLLVAFFGLSTSPSYEPAPPVEVVPGPAPTLPDPQ